MTKPAAMSAGTAYNGEMNTEAASRTPPIKANALKYIFCFLFHIYNPVGAGRAGEGHRQREVAQSTISSAVSKTDSGFT